MEGLANPSGMANLSGWPIGKKVILVRSWPGPGPGLTFETKAVKILWLQVLWNGKSLFPNTKDDGEKKTTKSRMVREVKDKFFLWT